MTELDEIINLHEATRTEALDLFERVVENSGGLVIKPGSPALAVFYAYEEIVGRLWAEVGSYREAIGGLSSMMHTYLERTGVSRKEEA